jgi:hypothetical protein
MIQIIQKRENRGKLDNEEETTSKCNQESLLNIFEMGSKSLPKFHQNHQHLMLTFFSCRFHNLLSITTMYVCGIEKNVVMSLLLNLYIGV